MADAGSVGSGALAGAGTGAAIGSFIPVWGTAVGAAVGGIIGGVSAWLSDDEKENKQKALKAKVEQLMANRPEYTAPTYQIPKSEEEYLANAKQQRDSSMPGYAQMKDDIYGSTAQGNRNIQQASNSVAGTLGATSQLYGGQMKSLSGLDIASAQYKQQMADKYQSALQTDATWQDKAWQTNQDYKDKAWNWNVGQKYGEQYNYLQSQLGGANADYLAYQKNMAGMGEGGMSLLGDVIKAKAKAGA